MTARTRYGSGEVTECGELLHGKRFSLKLKGVVLMNYVEPEILCVSEVLLINIQNIADK